jgi:putative endonuclease
VTGPRQQLGAAGELAVARRYEADGFTVLDRNWRDGRRGELDLVLGRDGLVVVCEVKTRTGSAFGDGAEAVDRAKQARLRRLAMAWVAAHRDDVGWVDLRIDVAVVRWPVRSSQPQIEIIESAC